MEILRKLQLTQLDILLEVDRICKKNNISYFLIGGTLLGAVRHKGFIPWDDDIDIGMSRKDYEKFCNICKENLNSNYFFQDWHTDNQYGYGFAKIRINGTKCITEVAKKTNAHIGISLDIFPFDHMPDNYFAQKIHYFTFTLCKKVLMSKMNYKMSGDSDNILHKFYHFMYDVLSKCISRNKLINMIENIATKYNSKETTKIINLFGAYRYNEVMDLHDCDELDSVNFEGYEFTAPSNYDKFLQAMYGDYMKLPPVEVRGKHHTKLIIEFGSYEPSNDVYMKEINTNSNKEI